MNKPEPDKLPEDQTIPPRDQDSQTILPQKPATRPFSDPVSETPDQKIGNYRLIEKLGEGGMGTVWLAEQERPVRRKIALKVIRGGLASKEVIARFEAERQALSMMDHRSIARVLDGGETENGNPYFVMELVDGAPITTYCDKNRLAIHQRLQLMVQVCQAVQHAHQKGIMHRDLKPSNILVTEYEGEPLAKVIDFGLAKALESTTKLTDKTIMTEFGQVVGTLQYMSPEQAELDSLNIDTRTDVYALGIILYELLTGTTPIEKESFAKNAMLQILEMIREKEPQRPSERLSSGGLERTSVVAKQRKITPTRLQGILQGEMDWVIMKALEKDRNRRYETAKAFADDIARYLDDEPVLAKPPSAGYKLKKFASKNRGLVAAVATILLLLSGGIAATSWFAIKANDARILAEEKEDIARLETEKAKASELATEKALAEADYVVANIRQRGGRVAEALKVLERIPEHSRNVEWYLSKNEFAGSDLTLVGHHATVSAVDWSPNGRWIVSAGADNKIRIWDPVSGKGTKAIDDGIGSVSGLCFSHDSRWLAASYVEGIVVVRATSDWSEKHRLVRSSAVNSIVFDPSGDWLAVAEESSGGLLWEFESADERIATIWEKEKRLQTGSDFVAFGNSGDQLFLSDDRHIFEVNVSPEELVGDRVEVERSLISNAKPSGRVPFAFHPDGTSFAHVEFTGGGRSRIRLVNMLEETSDTFDDAGKSNSAIDRLRFDGSGLYLGAVRGNAVAIWNRETFSSFDLLGHHGQINDFAFGPDASRLVTASDDGTLKIWDIKSGKKRLSIDYPEPLERVHFPAGGKELVVTSSNSIYVRSTKDLESARSFSAGDPDDELDPRFHVTSVRRAGLDLLARRTERGTVELVDLMTGELKKKFSIADVFAAISPDAKTAVVLQEDDEVPAEMIWLESGKARWTLDPKRDVDNLENVKATYSNTGKFVVINSYTDSGGLVQIWESETGKLVRLIETDVYSEAYSFDKGDQRFALGDSETLMVLDCGSWNPVSVTTISDGQATRNRGEEVTSLAFHPSMKRLAVGTSRDVFLINWETGDEVSSLTAAGYVNDLSWSVDGDWLAAACDDGTLKIWDASPNADVESNAAAGSWREYKARISQSWHADSADAAEARGDWYAALFHRAWLLKSAPDQALAWDLLQDAYAKFNDAGGRRKSGRRFGWTRPEPEEVTENNPPKLSVFVQECLEMRRGTELPRRAEITGLSEDEKMLWGILLYDQDDLSSLRLRFDTSLLKVASDSKSNPESICLYALSQLRTNEIDGAIESAKRALVADDEFALAYGILTLAYRQKQMDKKAAQMKKRFEDSLKKIKQQDRLNSEYGKAMLAWIKGEEMPEPLFRSKTSRGLGLRSTIWPERVLKQRNVTSNGGGVF